MTEQEIGGVLFTPLPDNKFRALDLNYGMTLGTIQCDEGPGWVLILECTFLDSRHFHTLTQFIQSLPTPKEED